MPPITGPRPSGTPTMVELDAARPPTFDLGQAVPRREAPAAAVRSILVGSNGQYVEKQAPSWWPEAWLAKPMRRDTFATLTDDTNRIRKTIWGMVMRDSRPVLKPNSVRDESLYAFVKANPDLLIGAVSDSKPLQLAYLPGLLAGAPQPRGRG